MPPDHFASPVISQILTWIISIPLFIGLIVWTAKILFEKEEGVPRVFMIWLLLCLLLFSPLRYILFQVLVASVFPFQSISAFLATFALALYIPIVFGILYAIGLGLPLLLILKITGDKETPSKARLFAAGILAPFIFFIFSMIYFKVLPYAA